MSSILDDLTQNGCPGYSWNSATPQKCLTRYLSSVHPKGTNDMTAWKPWNGPGQRRTKLELKQSTKIDEDLPRGLEVLSLLCVGCKSKSLCARKPPPAKASVTGLLELSAFFSLFLAAAPATDERFYSQGNDWKVIYNNLSNYELHNPRCRCYSKNTSKLCSYYVGNRQREGQIFIRVRLLNGAVKELLWCCSRRCSSLSNGHALPSQLFAAAPQSNTASAAGANRRIGIEGSSCSRVPQDVENGCGECSTPLKSSWEYHRKKKKAMHSIFYHVFQVLQIRKMCFNFLSRHISLRNTKPIVSW